MSPCIVKHFAEQHSELQSTCGALESEDWMNLGLHNVTVHCEALGGATLRTTVYVWRLAKYMSESDDWMNLELHNVTVHCEAL